MNSNALALDSGYLPVLPVISLEKAKGEMIRKGIHLLVAAVPSLALLHKELALFLLAGGIVIYTVLEALSLKGFKIPVFYLITGAATRERDKGRFALGPVTLGVGAALSLMLFPQKSAFVAIYALAFGDGFASLVGRIFGRTRPAFLAGKSVEGSLTCFVAIYFSTLHLAHNWYTAFLVAAASTIVEALPLKDWDNLIIPLTAGYIATLIHL